MESKMELATFDKNFIKTAAHWHGDRRLLDTNVRSQITYREVCEVINAWLRTPCIYLVGITHRNKCMGYIRISRISRERTFLHLYLKEYDNEGQLVPILSGVLHFAFSHLDIKKLTIRVPRLFKKLIAQLSLETFGQRMDRADEPGVFYEITAEEFMRWETIMDHQQMKELVKKCTLTKRPRLQLDMIH